MALFLMVSTLTPSDAFPLLPANVQHPPIQCSLQPSSRTSKKLVDRPVCVKNPEARAREPSTLLKHACYEIRLIQIWFFVFKNRAHDARHLGLRSFASWHIGHIIPSDQSRKKQNRCLLRVANWRTLTPNWPRTPKLAQHWPYIGVYFFPNSCSTKGHGWPNAPFASNGGQFWRQGFRAKNSCPTLDAS